MMRQLDLTAPSSTLYATFAWMPPFRGQDTPGRMWLLFWIEAGQ